jgi:hypothetical protein
MPPIKQKCRFRRRAMHAHLRTSCNAGRRSTGAERYCWCSPTGHAIVLLPSAAAGCCSILVEPGALQRNPCEELDPSQGLQELDPSARLPLQVRRDSCTADKVAFQPYCPWQCVCLWVTLTAVCCSALSARLNRTCALALAETAAHVCRAVV